MAMPSCFRPAGGQRCHRTRPGRLSEMRPLARSNTTWAQNAAGGERPYRPVVPDTDCGWALTPMASHRGHCDAIVHVETAHRIVRSAGLIAERVFALGAARKNKGDCQKGNLTDPFHDASIQFP